MKEVAIGRGRIPVTCDVVRVQDPRAASAYAAYTDGHTAHGDTIFEAVDALGEALR